MEAQTASCVVQRFSVHTKPEKFSTQTWIEQNKPVFLVEADPLYKRRGEKDGCKSN